MANLELYRKIGKFKLFKKNDIVFTQGDVGNDMFVVIKGAFGVYTNSFTDFPTHVADIKEDAFFGEMAVIDGWPRSATIICEENGSAVSIDKESFMKLIESEREISSKILSILIERTTATAEIVRSRGKSISDLPANIKNADSESPKVDFERMVMLAQRIRELNDILSSEEKRTGNEIKHNTDTVMLLPTWAKRYNQADENDNSKILANWEYVCPHCLKGFKGKLPLFSRLEEKSRAIDGRIVYSNFNMLFYINIVCPNCNYTDIYQEFQKERARHTPLVTGNQFKNFEKFTGYKDELTHTLDEVILSFYLNLHCLRQMQDSELRQAKSWHRLYWIYLDINELDAAREAAKQAASNFAVYIAKSGENLSSVDLMTVNFIIGELYVFLRDIEKAREYFLKNTAISGFTTHELAIKSIRRIAELKNE